MSERVERRIVEMLDGPVVSPYGNPVPGLVELGVAEGDQTPAPRPVSELADAGVTSVTVVRLGEYLQAMDDALAGLVAAGVLPGATVGVAAAGDDVVLTGPEGPVALGRGHARHVFVLPS